MPKENKKYTFSGSVARRILLICLAVLVLPLFVYTFFLYREEVLLQEQDVRTTMRAVGAEIAQGIGRHIQIQWRLFDGATPALVKLFQMQSWTPPLTADPYFALINDKDLIVGKRMGPLKAVVIQSPLSELIAIPQMPFPIDVSLESLSLKQEQWIERFEIEGTHLVLELGTSSERIVNLQWRQILSRVGIFLVLVFFVGGAILFLLYRQLTSPLIGLQSTMERVAQGAVHSRYTPKTWGFEINAIGEKFNDTLEELLFHQQQIEEERLKREQLASELRIGREIQASLLPKKLAHIAGIEITASYLPAKDVGGDFYEIFPISETKSLIAIGDVSGKGVSACLYSLSLKSSLRAFATMQADLQEIARKANDLFLLDVQESGFFATLVLAMVEENHIRYASFGHPPQLMCHQGEVIALKAGGRAFGVEPFDVIETHDISLHANDLLLLYTDGAIEAHDVNSNLFGIERLKATLACAMSAEDLAKEIAFFSQNVPQHDDIALLLLKNNCVKNLTCCN